MIKIYHALMKVGTFFQVLGMFRVSKVVIKLAGRF